MYPLQDCTGSVTCCDVCTHTPPPPPRKTCLFVFLYIQSLPLSLPSLPLHPPTLCVCCGGWEVTKFAHDAKGSGRGAGGDGPEKKKGSGSLGKILTAVLNARKRDYNCYTPFCNFLLLSLIKPLHNKLPKHSVFSIQNFNESTR